MDWRFIASEILFVFIAISSGFIAYDFYRAKNGKLRRLMIALFLSKVWLYGGSAVYLLVKHYKHLLWISDQLFPVIACTPMFITMLFIWKYVRVDILKNGK